MKKFDMKSALQRVGGKPQTESHQEVAKDETQFQKGKLTSKSRIGKKAVIAHVDIDVARELKRLSIDENKTMQLLLQEAINELFIKYGRNPIA